MLDQIAKALAVVEELKGLPSEERVWLLQATQDFARQQREFCERRFSKETGAGQLALLRRIETIKVAERLLGTIPIRL